MFPELEAISRQALEDWQVATDPSALDTWQRTYTNKKKGVLAPFFSRLRDLEAEQRSLAGKQLHALITEWESWAAASGSNPGDVKDVNHGQVTAVASRAFWGTDATVPLGVDQRGSRHPLSAIRQRLIDILTPLGFVVGQGPHIESEFYNFDALNIPAHHPARDMQDTFYADIPATESGRWVLRTHTSPVQIRYMQANPVLPIRMIAPGRVFRADSDATHSPMFQQLEGLWIEDGVSFAHLKGLLQFVMSSLFEKDLDVRLRPSFFPFTEPSAEVDMQCFACNGHGCRICSQSGWIEVLGCGMVHPAVLQAGGLSPDATGLAFGLGIERLAMLQYGIRDIRHFYRGSLELASQMRGARL